MPIRDIILLGAGNVGTHLGKAFHNAGLQIRQVFSRSMERSGNLAKALQASSTQKLERIAPGADLYVLAVSDDAIPDVARGLGRQLGPEAFVVHTSGATPSKVLAGIFPRHGVFYPLQSLSSTRELAFEGIPLCVHAASPADEDRLETLARSLSHHVYRLDDADRAQLHLAAVFANNFTNQLFHIAQDLLKARGLSFDLLRPLILETASKVQHQSPASAQTGPAIRGDTRTILKHLELLEKHPDYRDLYISLTRSIDPDNLSLLPD